MIKQIGYFVSGAVFGSSVCWIVVNHHYKKKSREEIRKEVDKFKKDFEEAHKYETAAEEKRRIIDVEAEVAYDQYEAETKEESEPVNISYSNDDISSAEGSANYIHYENFGKKFRHTGKKEDMSKLSKKAMKDIYETQKDEEEFDDYDEDEEDIPEGPSEGISETPYSITPEVWASNPNFDKISLTYYAGDKVLVWDDDDEEVIDVARFVGKNFSDHIGEYEPETVYIRNEKQGADYEITSVPHKYYED